MNKNIFLCIIIGIVSVFIFSSKSRKAVTNSINDDTKDKICEMKNILVDFRKNQNAYK